MKRTTQHTWAECKAERSAFNKSAYALAQTLRFQEGIFFPEHSETLALAILETLSLDALERIATRAEQLYAEHTTRHAQNGAQTR